MEAPYNKDLLVGDTGQLAKCVPAAAYIAVPVTYPPGLRWDKNYENLLLFCEVFFTKYNKLLGTGA
jgi:hypothetical protein